MATAILHPVLSSRNPHIRDANMLFDEPSHKYTIITDPNSKYTSVTTWNHSHFSHFDADAIIKKMMSGKKWNSENKYWGQTPQEIKDLWSTNASNVSGAGTTMHFNIECFMNNPTIHKKEKYTHKDLIEAYENQTEFTDNSVEWSYFIKFAKAFPDLIPYRTEWMIYHDDIKLAGSIDMVYENPDGTLMIYDWKRCKDIAKTNNFNKYALTECINNLPDTNFWHYSLQLNTYKAILEAKYGKTVTSLYLVRLHPDNLKESYDLIKVPNLQDEIAELFMLRKKELMNNENNIETII